MTQDEALCVLKTGANVFLTGEPGSGKTHTVNAYVRWLREHEIEPSITASTGIAATHIGGLTIHSWSGIGIKRSLSEYELDAIAQNKKVYGRMRDAKVLIIDEVSMLAANTLDMVDAVCREARRDKRPFGGLQVVLVGDFFQLPPVNKSDEENADEQALFAKPTQPAFAFRSNAWKSLNPLVCYLSEQHRQEDAPFLDFLTALRRAEINESHYELLRTRYKKSANAGATQLFSHNADVDRLNLEQLKKLDNDTHDFSMTSFGPAKLVENIKRGCLSPEVLSLKIGARVMFTKNDTITQRFANGTLGIVSSFDKETGYPVIKTTSGRTVHIEPMEWTLVDGGKVLARVTQVPLRLAWAMTVHKSQGMSLDGAHMDLSGVFEYGQGYVALSRVRTLAGLSLAGLSKKALEVHPEILEEDQNFRTLSQTARDAFAALPSQELAIMRSNFIRACGGKEPSVV